MTTPDRSPGGSLPVTIVIPAYGAAAQLRACLASLVKHAPARCEIVVADDATPDDSIAEVVREFEPQLSLVYIRRERNLGFVENCNEAIGTFLPSGNDILLLNSDTEVTEGFLEEMWEVLHLHEKHGAVSPRSDNATIYSVPIPGGLPPTIAFQLWQSLHPLLPRYQVMPTAVGYCLLIKNAVLRQLGAFDPVYSPGYNEENDFICRINRHGYSALVAHHAFVYHRESSSFGSGRKALEKRNRQVLTERYPEYVPNVQHHLQYGVDPVDHFSTLWLDHRKTILFDLFHLPAKHCGTSEFALNLLLRLAPLLEDRYELTIGVSEKAQAFFAPELTGYHVYDPRRAEDRFDLVFKPSQIFTWQELRRMVRLGGRMAYTLLDIINARCDYIASPDIRMLFRTSAQVADRVMTISEFSKRDFMAFYGAPASFEVIYPGTLETRTADARGKHVLVVGNGFEHKAVLRAVRELEGVGSIVVLGGDAALDRNVRWLVSGALSRADFADLDDRAAVLVYPSFYEGFGMPILDALTRGIPVVALDSTVNRELLSLTGSDALFLVKEHSEMRAVVARLLAERSKQVGTGRSRTWGDVAADYARSFEELLARDLDVELIRRRWELMTMIDAVYWEYA